MRNGKSPIWEILLMCRKSWVIGTASEILARYDRTFEYYYHNKEGK